MQKRVLWVLVMVVGGRMVGPREKQEIFSLH